MASMAHHVYSSSSVKHISPPYAVLHKCSEHLDVFYA